MGMQLRCWSQLAFLVITIIAWFVTFETSAANTVSDDKMVKQDVGHTALHEHACDVSQVNVYSVNNDQHGKQQSASAECVVC